MAIITMWPHKYAIGFKSTYFVEQTKIEALHERANLHSNVTIFYLFRKATTISFLLNSQLRIGTEITVINT